MKKLLFFAAALFAAVSFSACSDDDDNNVNSNLLYGTWQEVHSSGYALENGQKVDEWDEVVREKSFYSFNSNGTGSYDNDAVEWDIRYTQSGNKLQMNCTDTQRDETFNYTWTIESLTETELVATEYSKSTEDGDVYEEFDTLVFKRVR